MKKVSPPFYRTTYFCFIYRSQKPIFFIKFQKRFLPTKSRFQKQYKQKKSQQRPQCHK
ncbi:hypothetical protein BACCOP_00148 [Phocaeicola coprocola DSM 17136]|uniref:Uncharacterized protein n=1 Tax=Phocaeicola coprocola DSM 17136 TaxID=470145 RepID=B3JE59_9BACT|nr:hypothetical protein BACCOP_00148 [Phocaeicola coprocola DSM 17136]